MPFVESPQEQGYQSLADEVFFGGGAGGSKTDLILGLAVTKHKRSLLLRRESTHLTGMVERLKQILGARGSWRGTGPFGGTMRFEDGPIMRVIELGGCKDEKDKSDYMGRPHDLVAFDEGAQFTQSMFRFIRGWNRSEDPKQRCRVVLAGNPPMRPEERWIIEEFAPWLDRDFREPANAGELRWFTYLDNKLHWLKSGVPLEHKGEKVIPRSRTFIPARVTDNPVYMASNYIQVLQSMPEPLRSQLLYGDMNAGTEDDPRQVIPTAWVQTAQERWTPEPPAGCSMSSLGADVARGGLAQTVFAPRYKTWFGPLEKHKGQSTPDGPAVAALVLKALLGHPYAWVHIDVIGYGASPYDHLRQHRPPLNIRAIDFAEGTEEFDRTKQLSFRNLRAWAYWHMRDLLDPQNKDPVALPPDPELLADLCAPRWEYTLQGIQLEDKRDIAKRIGRSPDCGDAVVMAALPVRPVTISMPAPGKANVLDRLPRGVFGRGI